MYLFLQVIGYIALFVLILMVFLTKDIYDYFIDKNAFSKDRKISFDYNFYFKRKIFERMLRVGEVVENNGKYFLVLDIHNQLKDKRARKVKILFPIIVLLLFIITAKFM